MTQTTKRRIPELLFPGILRFLLGMRTFYSPAVFYVSDLLDLISQFQHSVVQICNFFCIFF